MVDARTPVIVGVGQWAEQVDDPGYQALSPVELAAAAARAAVEDAGVDLAKAAAVLDVVAGVRQFEISGPAESPLGRSSNYPRSVANRLGAESAHAVLEVTGGHGPQHLATEFAAAIEAGRIGAALLFGSDAISTQRFYAGRADRPDFAETVAGQLDDRGFGYESFVDDNLIRHGVYVATMQYGLMENARRGLLGLGVAEYRHRMAELFAPFTAVAAANPFSAAPVIRSAAELAAVTPSNRLIYDPYPRLMVARDQVNQGAAALLMSVELARRLGVPETKWVYLRGHADLVEQGLLARRDIGVSPAAPAAVREALRVAGIGLDDVATFDFYSCFPVPVFNVCDGLGLAADDPRGLTVTGGLPFFGGPGNNYSMHAIAETVHRMRRDPGGFGLVGANGGIMSKYSVGLYSTEPADWVPDHSAGLQAEIDTRPTVPVAVDADGPATIETYTVRYVAGEPQAGVVIGRLAADGRRFLATVEDADLIAAMSRTDPLGLAITVRNTPAGNRAIPT